MAQSRWKKQRVLSEKFINFNWNFADKLLEIYLKKCSEKYRLAFYQYMRQVSPDELRESFTSQKQRM